MLTRSAPGGYTIMPTGQCTLPVVCAMRIAGSGNL
jgi:hypothetical protein